jgi:DNA polymerase epsilon subunit 2
VIIGEVNLDDSRTLPALRRILSTYAAESQAAAPLSYVITGNFTKQPIMTRGRGRGSVEYKEYFDELGTVLAEFPSLVRDSTFVFVPGDNDGWISAGATGASTPVPRKPIPDLFTSRIRRVFASQASDDEAKAKPEAIWASNPSRLSLFGPTHEIVLFRDDMLARMQRNAVAIRDRGEDEDANGTDDVSMADSQPEEPEPTESMDVDESRHKYDEKTAAAQLHTAQKLVKTILDQGYLSPFPPAIRPVHWDYSSALHLYPLPSAMVLVDTTCPPFCVTYDHCHVMNPGSMLVSDRRGVARWIEYRIGSLGQVKDCSF